MLYEFDLQIDLGDGTSIARSELAGKRWAGGRLYFLLIALFGLPRASGYTLTVTPVEPIHNLDLRRCND